jgi:hypothetical protein
MLEESERLDPAGGTLLHLALCRDHEGKTATAWAAYRAAFDAARRDGRKDRMRVARARIDALEPRIAHLKIQVAAGDRKLGGFQLHRDGTLVNEPLWGAPLPVDPGSHTITARAEGFKTWTTKIEVPRDQAELQVVVPDLELDISTREVASAAPAAPPAQADLTPASSPPAESPPRGDRQRTLGLVAGGIGVAGVVVGSVLGLMAIAKHNAADGLCEPPEFTRCKTQAGVEDGTDSSHFGNASTITFVAAGVLLLAGVTLYFTAPSPDRDLRGAAFLRHFDLLGASGTF